VQLSSGENSAHFLFGAEKKEEEKERRNLSFTHTKEQKGDRRREAANMEPVSSGNNFLRREKKISFSEFTILPSGE